MCLFKSKVTQFRSYICLFSLFLHRKLQLPPKKVQNQTQTCFNDQSQPNLMTKSLSFKGYFSGIVNFFTLFYLTYYHITSLSIISTI